jgi:hypothetical protein
VTEPVHGVVKLVVGAPSILAAIRLHAMDAVRLCFPKLMERYIVRISCRAFPLTAFYATALQIDLYRGFVCLDCRHNDAHANQVANTF